MDDERLADDLACDGTVCEERVIPGEMSEDRRGVSARRVATDKETLGRVDVEGGCVFDGLNPWVCQLRDYCLQLRVTHPLEGCQGVVEAGRERMLWGKSTCMIA